MKKTDVVRLIASILEENTDPKWLDLNSHETALMILGALEKAGMKPPVERLDPVLLRKEFTWEQE